MQLYILMFKIDMNAIYQFELKEMELLRTIPPSLNSYYRQKVNDYFQSIDK